MHLSHLASQKKKKSIRINMLCIKEENKYHSSGYLHVDTVSQDFSFSFFLFIWLIIFIYKYFLYLQNKKKIFIIRCCLYWTCKSKIDSKKKTKWKIIIWFKFNHMKVNFDCCLYLQFICIIFELDRKTQATRIFKLKLIWMNYFQSEMDIKWVKSLNFVIDASMVAS